MDRGKRERTKLFLGYGVGILVMVTALAPEGKKVLHEKVEPEQRW